MEDRGEVKHTLTLISVLWSRAISAFSSNRVESLCVNILGEAMPRLGEDPNVATAYPNRSNTNLRGSWMRQFVHALLASLLIVFIFNKLIKADYKVQCALSAKRT